MRVLLWHGYLLTGSGSNIYNASVVRCWRAQGHDVLLMCQERHAGSLDFIDADGAFAQDNLGYATAPTGIPAGPGSCTLVRPHIGEVLPVYVYDAYEGFTAKRYVDITDAELDAYTDANVVALRTAVDEFRPDAIITGHEVMGPEIARRALQPQGIPYLAKLHGSALEYAVKVQERYLRWAASGLGAAAVVTGGSRYMVREASRVIPGIAERAEVVNPGCDVSLFRPMPRAKPGGPTVAYVGKLIASKGVHNLLAALGLVEIAGLNAVIVGYGGYAQGLQDLADALSTGDLDRASAIARRGETGSLDDVVRFLDDIRGDEGYLQRLRDVAIAFTGRLDHGPLSGVLPTFDLVVVPSVLAEAFGMVAAEAAACGVLPVVPGHSGIGEIGEALEERLGTPGLLTFDPSDPVRGIARCIENVLRIEYSRRVEMERAAADLARERWAWERIAETLLSLALRG